jgi:plastocyanin
MIDPPLLPRTAPLSTNLRRLGQRCAVIAVLAVLAACGSEGPTYATTPPPPPPAVLTVNATPALAFTPSELNVNAGDSVHFAFGSLRHNVNFDGTANAPDDIRGDNVDSSVTRVFNSPGTFHYTCHIHPAMQGVVVVRPRVG